MYKKIKIPIYDQYLHICINKTVKKVHETLRKKKIECGLTDNDYGAEALALMDFNDYGAILIITEESVAHGTIAHELDHITHELLSFVGMKRTDSSDEAYSYLKGYLVKTVSIEIKAKGIKIND